MVERFGELVEGVLQGCRSRRPAALSPADFPDARISQRQLDRLLRAAGARN
jgi:hypothetical protein